MKKIFYILSICVMTILQPSCDALDLAPEDYYGAGNFWKEASHPGCLSAFRAQNRQICGTRWFLLNAARFPA